MGFKVMPPATAEVITALPVTTLQIRFFSLVQVALLFLAVMVFVVIGVEIFQHITCPFGQGCVDVVEVKNIFLGVNHWHYNKKTQKISDCTSNRTNKSALVVRTLRIGFSFLSDILIASNAMRCSDRQFSWHLHCPQCSIHWHLSSGIGIHFSPYGRLWCCLGEPLMGPGGTFGLGGPCSSVLPLGSWAPCGPCAPVSPLGPYWPVSPLGPCEPVPSLGPWAPVSPLRAGPPVILPHLCDPVPLYNLLVLDVPLGLYHLWLLVPPCVPCGPSGPQGPTRWALWDLVELEVSSIVLLMYPII